MSTIVQTWRDGSSANADDPMPGARQLATFIREHAPLFVLTGAGCSTASGIPDYRDDNGDWKHSKPVQFSDFKNSKYTRQRYWARSLLGWPGVDQSRPNPAHAGLAALEKAGLVGTICTQNVDALHQKAGSTLVIDLHGRLDSVECLQCDARFSRATVQTLLLRANPAYRKVRVDMAPDGDVLFERPVDDFVLVNCDRCGGHLKPSVVFFGESVPVARVSLARKALEASVGMLVVGSSLMIYSGYRFCRLAETLAKPIVVLNRGKTRADPILDLKISEDCCSVLDQTVRLLGVG